MWAPSHPYRPLVTFHLFASLGSRGKRLSHCHRNISEIFDTVIRTCRGRCQRPARTPRPPQLLVQRPPVWPGPLTAARLGFCGEEVLPLPPGLPYRAAVRGQTQRDRWLRDRSSRTFLSPSAFEISRKGRLPCLKSFTPAYLNGKFQQEFLNTKLNSSAQQSVRRLAARQAGQSKRIKVLPRGVQDPLAGTGACSVRGGHPSFGPGPNGPAAAGRVDRLTWPDGRGRVKADSFGEETSNTLKTDQKLP